MHFQFSLWDSIFYQILLAYGTTLSILFMRFRRDDQEFYCKELVFQFSLWDSTNMRPRCIDWVHRLSILFMRFSKTTCKRLFEGSRLSILFMRFLVGTDTFPIINGTFNSLYEIQWEEMLRNKLEFKAFQFSLWDSFFWLQAYQCIKLNFQFSLWDSHWNYAWNTRITRLSILFMRFHSGPITFGHPLASFNSLYEIQLHHLNQCRIWKYHFQFSLWDSITTPRLFRIVVETFNSLYEIRWNTSREYSWA